MAGGKIKVWKSCSVRPVPVLAAMAPAIIWVLTMVPFIMGFRDNGDAMLARIQSLEGDLARATATAERVSELERENQTMRAELAKYKARYDTPPRPPLPEPESQGSGRRLAFRIHEPGAPSRDETFSQSVIKIGKLSSSHIAVKDDSVSRVHAVIEVTNDKVSIIDLGSSAGTLVNGRKVNKVDLVNGDQIRVGDTEIMIGM